MPFGLTTWVAFLYAGSRAKRRNLLRAGWVYGGALVAGLALGGTATKGGTLAEVGASVLFVTWVVGMIHAGLVRQSVSEQLSTFDSQGRA